MTAEALSKVIIKGMEEKKASEILVLDLRKIKNAVSEFFVICSGNSDTQLEAISKSIEEEVHKVGENPAWRVEGRANGEWVLMDFVNVVVHIFMKEKREYYGLEELWGDAKTTLVN
ncbi:ribosome silencing factor [Algoriphagus sp. A40]|uniref:ribosome silencing factor n=1 Tax=Algoriphagus sp. A40 TaxID=1945863 RepID=UPI000986689B|nr:ribosome silencing factor [Algoriphagus sp. A40]OOG76207.1 ribosome silencing factor [Algoriphagus sp. A40]